MLFPYKYIRHDMQKMQKYMDFIFLEVCFKAKELGDFESSLFTANSEVEDIIRAYYFIPTAPEWGKFFVEKIKNIFDYCKVLDDTQIRTLKRWYKDNNKIEKLCKNEANPVTYTQLKSFHEDLAKEIKALYKKLYGKDILEVAKIKENLGTTLDKHYKKFFTKNSDYEVCPFCGLSPMLGINHTKKEAYDHYLPKSKYPFNSINFKNLAPMCHHCNSSYKTVKSPIFDSEDNRRKAFFPYKGGTTDINIKITIHKNDIRKVKSTDLELEITSPYQEEADTWKDVFGIDERYKAVCSGKNKTYWLNQILDEAPKYRMSKADYYKIKKEEFDKYPYTNEYNFLRVPFLEACKEAEIL